jgi:eukaryotic-like serine/threonine-protein kinase
VNCPSCHCDLPGDSRACPGCGWSLSDEGSTIPGPSHEPGLFAGRYRRLRELGRGGMGVVWLAEDVRLKRLVALKFLSADLAADAPARTRFLREAQAAASLDSPHVCTVYEADESGGHAYIAMAFIEGRSLRDRLAEGPLPIDDALAIARQIAEGIAEAHRRGVVHRDIKPANIMLARDAVAKVTDFGLARIQGSGESTKTAGIVGTLAYMSPEQAQGLRTDARTDVWSLGCVFYEMLAGRAPFSSGAGQVDLHALLHGAPRAIGECRPDAPPQLVEIIMRCLQKHPPQRYPDAGALLGDLQAVRAGAEAAAGAGPPLRDLPSIAVLPFADMSPDRSQGYFAEGIAEELIHALARIRGLRVVARTSAFALRDKGLDVREIGRVLDVGAVLEGSVRAAGNKLRITAQLINVSDGFHLWSERYDRDAGDIFAIQDEVSLAIVEQMDVTLHVGEREAMQKRTTVDHEAYNLYLKGLYLVARPRPDTLNTALRFFQEALNRDPGFAKAYAGIANVHGMLGNFNFAPPNEAWPKAKAAVAQALAIDPNLAEAHAIAAVAAFWYDWDWLAAEASFSRILSLNPGDAFTRGAYAWFLLSRRRFDECLREIEVCLRLDPLLPLFYGWSVGLHAAVGKLDEALRVFAKAVELDPTFGLPYFHAAVAYLRLGKFDDAVRTLETGSRLAASPGWGEGVLAFIAMRRGNADGARRIVEQMVEQRRRTNVSPVGIAWAFGTLGRADEAIAWLERGIEEHDTLVGFLHIYTPWFAPALAHDPRFAAILERLGLADVADERQ